MPRPHSRGYIRQEDYWNIGTEAQRGRDGMNAREAAQRYNDHRHPAFVATVTNDLVVWRDARLEASAINVGSTSLPGGYEVTNQVVSARQPGDMVFYEGVPFMTDGTNVQGISGFGGELAQDGAFTPDSLVLTLAQSTRPIRVPAEGAVDALLDIPEFSALLRPNDVRVASAAEVKLELSCLASVEFSAAAPPTLTANTDFAPYADVQLVCAALTEDLTAPTSGPSTSFRAEAYSGTPGDALLRNVGQTTPGHRYEASVIDVPTAGLYQLKYRFANLGEAGIENATQQQTDAYNTLLDDMTLVIHGLTLRLQLKWVMQ